MVRVTSTRTMNAPNDRIWRLLSDLERLPDFDPAVERVEITSKHSKGLGATRAIQYANGSEEVEEVVQVGRGFIIFKPKLYNGPGQDFTITYTVHAMVEDWTEITIEANYNLSFSPWGLWEYLLHLFVHQRRLRKQFQLTLEGIEHNLSKRRKMSRTASNESLASTALSAKSQHIASVDV